MRDFRFGIKPIKESTRVETRLKSIFGLKPLKKVAEEATGFSFEPINYTIDYSNYQGIPRLFTILNILPDGKPVGKITPIALKVISSNVEDDLNHFDGYFSSEIYIYPEHGPYWPPSDYDYFMYFNLYFDDIYWWTWIYLYIQDNNSIDLLFYNPYYFADPAFPNPTIVKFGIQFQDEAGNTAWLEVTITTI